MDRNPLLCDLELHIDHCIDEPSPIPLEFIRNRKDAPPILFRLSGIFRDSEPELYQVNHLFSRSIPPEAGGARPRHGTGARAGVLIATLVLLCLICWAGALNTGGRALPLLRLVAGQRLDACDPVGGGLGWRL